MKGGFYGLRGKQISLTLIALICATIFIWGWDKTSLLGNFLPPQSQLLKPSPPENILSVPIASSIYSKPDVHVKEDSSDEGREGEERSEQENKFFVDSKAENTADKTDMKYTTPPVEQKENLLESSEEQKNSEQEVDGETRTEIVEKTPDSGTQISSETTTKHDLNGKTQTELAEKTSDLGTQIGSETTSEHDLNGEIRTEAEEKTPDLGTQIGSETTSDQELNGKTRTELVEKTSDSVIQMGSETTTPDKTEDDENSTTDLQEKKEVQSSSSEEENEQKHGLNGETRTESVKKSSDSGMQMGSETTTSYETEYMKNSTADFEDKKACNYAKGKWVEDNTRPLYSGFGCKQWLSAMWACRLTQRTDFSYERFRWHPNNCEMPEFEGSSFLKRMKDKTVAVIGDSLGRQQFQSLMCMVTGGKQRSDVLDVGKEYGLVKANGATRPDGWAYRFPTTNTTILYYWSASLSDLEPINITNPATDWAMHLDRPPAFLRRYLHRFDVLVLNTGHHWNRGKLRANRWVMYVGGVPNTNRKIAEIGGAKNFTVYSIVKWLDSQLPQHPKLKAFFRTISPRHFFHGDWNSGGSCDNTTPLAGGKEVLQDESDDPVASGAVKGTQVRLLDITAVSQLRDEGHISRYSIKATPGVQDCLHWCLPGVPDAWNEFLFAQL